MSIYDSIKVDLEHTSECGAFADCLNVNFEKPFMIIGLVGAVLLIVYQSLGRYVFAKYFPAMHIPFWTEELARFMFIWSMYFAIPLTIKHRENIRVDVIYDKFSPKWRGILWMYSDLAFIVMAGSIFYTSLGYIHMQWEFEQETAALRIPYYIPYAILPLGFGLMVIRLIQDISVELKTSSYADFFSAVFLIVLSIAPVYLFEELNVLVLLFGYFILLLVLGVPVSICLGLATLATVIGADSLPMIISPKSLSRLSIPCLLWQFRFLSPPASLWGQEGFPSACLIWLIISSEVCPAESRLSVLPRACFLPQSAGPVLQRLRLSA